MIFTFFRIFIQFKIFLTQHSVAANFLHKIIFISKVNMCVIKFNYYISPIIIVAFNVWNIYTNVMIIMGQ